MRLFLSLMGISKNDYKVIFSRFDSLVDGYHLDVMDGSFVTSKTDLIYESYSLIKTYTTKPLWIHLMTTNPYNEIITLSELHKATITFHIESNPKINKTILAIKEKMGRPSLAISPHTSIFALEPFLDQVDHITVMSVNPGASGQKFIPQSIARIQTLGKLCKAHNQAITIACDGGINEKNVLLLKQNQVSDIALSSAIFKHKTVKEQIEALTTIRRYIE